MEISMLMIFTIFGVVSSWAKNALADGKVTLIEAVALVAELAGILGIKTELEIPTIPSILPPETEEEVQATGDEAEPGNPRPPPQ